MIRRFFVSSAVVFCAALTLSAAEQGKFPNISGTWKLNVEKSQFPRMAPTALVVTIKDTAETLSMSQVETIGERQRTIDLTLDKTGKETVNKVGPMEVRTTIKFENGKMLEQAIFETPQGRMTRTGVVTISDDHKTLIKESVYSGPQGEAKEKIVLEKQ